MTDGRKIDNSLPRKRSSKSLDHRRKKPHKYYLRSKLRKVKEANGIKEINEIKTINDLNDDCLGEIFKRVPFGDRVKLSKVCQRWKRVDKFSWNDFKKLDLRGRNSVDSHMFELSPEDRSPENISELLKKCGRFLRELTIGVPFTYQILSVVHAECKNLQKLVLDFEHYGIRFNETFFSVLKNLKSLSIYNVQQKLRHDFWSGPSESLEELLVHGKNHNLIDLNLLGLREFTKLSKLELGFFQLSYYDLPQITGLKGLRELTFKECHVEIENWEEVNCFLELKNLEKISFISSSTPDEDILNKLVTEHSSLKHLSFFDCPDIRWDTCDHLRNLNRVKIEYCPGEFFLRDPRFGLLDQIVNREMVPSRFGRQIYSPSHDFFSTDSDSSDYDY